MAKYYSGIDTSVGVGAETLDGMLANGSDFGILPSKDIDCANINASGIHTVGGFLYPNGGIKDSSDSIGSAGKVLSSTGSGLAWIDPSEGSTTNAINVGTNLNSTDADQFVAFMGANSGNNPVRVDSDLKYNPSTNILTAPSFSGNLTGTIQTAAQTNITSLGTLTGLTVNGNITQSGTSNYIRINGGLQDKDGEDGDSGQVLSSTGSQVNWVNVGDLSAGSASQVAVSDESTDTTCFPLFVTGATGNQSPKSGSNLTFNSADGTLSATTFSGSGASLTNIPSGQLSGALPAIDGSNLTGISDTTYDLLAVQTGGNNNDPAIKLDASSGDDDEIQIVGGTNVTVTRNSDSQITISSTDTDTVPTASTLGGTTLASGITGSSITSLGTLTGLNVNGTLTVQNGNVLQFGTSTNNNIRGQIGATETNDRHLIIATSGGEDIAFRDGGIAGTTNMVIRGDGNVLVNNGTLSATTFSGSGASLTDLPAGQLTGTIPDGRLSSSSLFVTGMIIMWNSTVASIPSGWVLCDGNNSTPDLRDRFIVGAGTGGSYSPGNTGGAASVTLSVAQMPSHSHSTNSHAHSFSGSGSHSHVLPVGRGGSQSNISGYIAYSQVEQIQNNLSTQSASVTVSGTTGGESPNTNPDGGGGSHENRPPYYALCYIMKT